MNENDQTDPGDYEQWVMNPPFPSELTTPLTLQTYLAASYDWVDYHRNWANEEARRLNAPEDPFIDSLGTHPENYDNGALMNVSVTNLFRSWMTMRAVRERHDWIYRNYEEAWDSDKCILHRILCLKAAAVALDNAFLDPEKFEARQADEAEKNRVHTVETLKSLGIPDKLLQVMGVLPDDDKEEIDFDRLFNPDV